MKIDDLFKERLSEDSLPAPDGLWERLESGLNAQMPHSAGTETAVAKSASVAAKSVSLVTKVVVGIGGLAAAALGGYFIFSDTPKQETARQIEVSQPQTPTTKQQTEEPKTQDAVWEIQKAVSTDRNAVLISQNSLSAEPLQDTLKQETVQKPQTPVKTETISTPESVIPPVEEPIVQNPAPQVQTAQQETAKVEIVEKEPEIKVLIPNVITPNGDGINDSFEILKLENYPDNQLVIYDRRGKVLFSVRDYQNDWAADGFPNGAYFYRLLIKHGQNSKIFKGSITVLR